MGQIENLSYEFTVTKRCFTVKALRIRFAIPQALVVRTRIEKPSE